MLVKADALCGRIKRNLLVPLSSEVTVIAEVRTHAVIIHARQQRTVNAMIIRCPPTCFDLSILDDTKASRGE